MSDLDEGNNKLIALQMTAGIVKLTSLFQSVFALLEEMVNNCRRYLYGKLF